MSDPVVNTKPIYLSKSALWGVIIALAPFIPGGSDFIMAHPEMSGIVFGVVTFILRLVTKDKVTLW